MPDDPLTLAGKIVVDPTPGEASLREFNATAQNMSKTIAQSLKEQNATAAQASQIYKQMGLAGGQAAREIEQAFGKAAAGAETVKHSAGGMSSEFYKSYAAAQLLGRELNIPIPFALARMIGQIEGIAPIMNAAFGVVVGGFVVEQIYRIVEGLEKSREEAEGLGKAWQAFQERQNEQILSNEPTIQLQKLTLQQTTNLQQQLEKYLQMKQSIGGINNTLAAMIPASQEVGSALMGMADSLKRAGVDVNDATKERIRLAEQVKQQQAALDKMIESGDDLEMRVKKSRVDAMEAGAKGAARYRAELQGLQLEEDQEVKKAIDREAAKERGYTDEIARRKQAEVDAAGAIQSLHEIYANKRLGLEHQITSSEDSEAQKRIAADQRWADAQARSMEHIKLIVERADAEWQRSFEKRKEVTFEFTKTYEASVRKVAELSAGLVPGLVQGPSPITLDAYLQLKRNALDAAQAHELLNQVMQMTEQRLTELHARFPNLILDEQHMTPAVQQAIKAMQDQERQAGKLAATFDQAMSRMAGSVGSGTGIIIESLLRMAAAEEQARAAHEKASLSEVATIGALTLQSILSRRAMALVEGAYYAAKAVAAWPDFVAMAEYGLASAMFFDVAGQGNKQTSTGSTSGGRGTASERTRGTRGAQTLAPTTATGNQAPQSLSGQLTVYVFGPDQESGYISQAIQNAVNSGYNVPTNDLSKAPLPRVLAG